MQEKQIRMLFDADVLKTVTILESSTENGWYLSFSRTKGDDFCMAAQRAPVRIFKTLGSAFRTASLIGFKEATVSKGDGSL